MVSCPGPCTLVRLGEQDAHFRRLQVAGHGGTLSLGGDRQDAVELLCMAGVMVQHVPEEGSQRGEPRVARAPSVLAVLFQVTQEVEDVISVEIVDSKVGRGPTVAQIGKEQLECVTI